MDPFIRQTALDILLKHTSDLTPKQLDEALQLGLADPDVQINELAWKYISKIGRVSDFKKELIHVAASFQDEGSDYFTKQASNILAAIDDLT